MTTHFPAIQVLARIRPVLPSPVPPHPHTSNDSTAGTNSRLSADQEQRSCCRIVPSTTNTLEVLVPPVSVTNNYGSHRSSSNTGNDHSSSSSSSSATTVPYQRLQFRFTSVYDAGTAQESFYTLSIYPTIMHTLSTGTPYNPSRLCICAYGQTGSGKTYTMLGGGKYSNRGIIQRCITSTFAAIDTLNKNNRTVYVALAAYQIYDEKVYDLLNTTTTESPKGGIENWRPITVQEKNNLVYLRNLRVYKVETEADALELVAMAHIARISAVTPMNRASSRSHCIITLSIHEHQPVSLSSFSSSSSIDSSVFPPSSGIPSTDPLLARITLVDLAGSERIYKTGTGNSSLQSPVNFSAIPPAFINNPSQVSALRTTEGVGINLSLHYLEACIVALYERNINQSTSLSLLPNRSPNSNGISSTISTTLTVPPPHIPYRNSMLTSVLRECLSGNCRLVFITTLSPELSSANETASTCRFAARCARLTPIIESRVHQIHQQQQQQYFLQQQQQDKVSKETNDKRGTGSLPLPLPPPSVPIVSRSQTMSTIDRPLENDSSLPLLDEDKRMIRNYLKEYIYGTGPSSLSSSLLLSNDVQSPGKDKTVARLPLRSLDEAHYAIALMRQMVESAVDTAAKYANMIDQPIPLRNTSLTDGLSSIDNDHDSTTISMHPPYANISRIENTNGNNKDEHTDNNNNNTSTLSDGYRSSTSPLRVHGNIRSASSRGTNIIGTMNDSQLVDKGDLQITVVDETIGNNDAPESRTTEEGTGPVVSPSRTLAGNPSLSLSTESLSANPVRVRSPLSPSLPPSSTDHETLYKPFLSKGSYFIKYPRATFAKPAVRKVWYDFTNRTLRWNDSKPLPTVSNNRTDTTNITPNDDDTDAHKNGSVSLNSLLEILPGQQTPAFRRFRIPPSRAGACLSIVSRNRTLDLQVYTPKNDTTDNHLHPTVIEKEQRDTWLKALEWLLLSQNT